MGDKRAVARRLANEAIKAGRPLDWFEQLYSRARTDGTTIPWADRVPNPNLLAFYEQIKHFLLGPHALKVGCGLGDDAEWLSGLGFDVTAFDIAPTAIAECRARFPASRVNYLVANLFAAPPVWTKAFDVVIESYTLQVLPADLRMKAIQTIAGFVASGGHLLLVTRARDESGAGPDGAGDMPWPLTRHEVDMFRRFGLAEICFEDYMDNESPSVRRFRACYRRMAE